MKLSKNKIKKIVLSAICILLTASTLSACSLLEGLWNVIETPQDIVDTSKNLDGGTNIAKLLLANKRLDSKQLDNDNIFDNGVQVFKHLANEASARRSDRPVTEGKKAVGSFTTSGNDAVWSDFDEYNNSYSYFENVTTIVINTAMRGADLIDEVKENVDIVDTWIKLGNEKYYLSVDKSSEVLCKVDDVELMICKRYTDTDGRTVYELYIEQDFARERVKYIPGERYEFTQMMPSVNQELYFVADHSKGYWETFTSTNNSESYNTGYTVMRNDVCYYVDYNILGGSMMLNVMSADTKTDFFSFNPGGYGLNITLKFQGFDGIVKAVAPKSDADDIGNLEKSDNVKVYLENGKVVKPGDTFANGTVKVDNIYLSCLADGLIGEFGITVDGETETEKWNNFALFLEETGLKCRRSWTTVYQGMYDAVEDASNLVKYYSWNGHVLSSTESISAAAKAETERIKEIRRIYESVADGEVITKTFASGSEDYANVDFAEIGRADWADVRIEGTEVNIGSATLAVSDVRLFEVGKSYAITFAVMSRANNDMIILGRGGSTEYGGGTPFEVGASSVSFNLPDLADGVYTLAAFISTDEDIRVSYGKAVEVDSVSQGSVQSVGVLIDMEIDNDKAVNITYSATVDHEAVLESVGVLGYTDLLETISASVYIYGIPQNDRLERLEGDKYVEVTSDSEITSGRYRMEYVLKTGSGTTRGYVYVEYSIAK